MRRRLLMLVAALPLTLLVLGYGASCASRTPGDLGLVEGRLRPCPKSPNCVSSEDARRDVDAFILPGDPEDDFRALVELIAGRPRAELVTFEEDYAHLIFRTAFFRFTDDLELRLDRERSRVHVRSASRIGHSDLGANRKRVEELMQLWASAATASGEEGREPD